MKSPTPDSARVFPPQQHYSTWINVLLRLLVGGAFVFAGGLKILDPSRFAVDISNYRLVPYEATHLVAILLPWIEVVAGSFILAGVWLQAAALVITCLTLVFLVVIVSALARGLNIECGCFGTVGGRHVGLVNLAMDSTLLLLAVILAKRSKADPVRTNFREAGAQNAATPLKASPRTS